MKERCTTEAMDYWANKAIDQRASEGAMDVTCVGSMSKWRRDGCYMRLISEQVKARWINEQTKARWMLHVFNQWASEGAIDQWANEGAMDVTCV